MSEIAKNENIQIVQASNIIIKNNDLEEWQQDPQYPEKPIKVCI